MSRTTSRTRPAPLGANYWKLFTASTMTNLGDGLMSVAVVWLASSITRDPLLIALIGLASRVPWLLFSLPAGVITDRYDRRLLVGWMDALRVLVIGGFAVLVLLNQEGLPTPEQLAAGTAPAPDNSGLLLAALCLVALLLGSAEVVRDNAAQTLMASIVDKPQLERANGRLWGAETAMNNFVGPPLGGVIVALALALPFFLNAGLLAAGAALIFALSGSFRPKGQSTSGKIQWRAEMGEGFRWLWDNHLLRTLAIILGAMNMLSALAFIIMVLFVQEILGLYEGWQFGLVITGTAVGAVAGSLVADKISARLSPGTSLFASITGMGLTMVVIGLTSSAPVVWVMGVISGLFVVLWNVITVSLRQRIIPDHLLGRVNSVYRFFGWGTISIGTLLGGVLVSVGEPFLGREWALRMPFLVTGVATLLLLIVALPRLNTAKILAAQAAAEVDQAAVDVEQGTTQVEQGTTQVEQGTADSEAPRQD
ncbi:MFS transporter [Ornithinimicrobium ciconiae]|uniref:MFS transporter n=1 Tax=Ornithinimicrobium ciconiae TaxID=2594265 RepID=A0A516G837_9MICO|nr:MFS transporter [Ornithinimicrobium ciconiae]QDO87687.1 MFS transporter [Ornithinimicrobium ciconiae]